MSSTSGWLPVSVTFPPGTSNSPASAVVAAKRPSGRSSAHSARLSGGEEIVAPAVEIRSGRASCESQGQPEIAPPTRTRAIAAAISGRVRQSRGQRRSASRQAKERTKARPMKRNSLARLAVSQAAGARRRARVAKKATAAIPKSRAKGWRRYRSQSARSPNGSPASSAITASSATARAPSGVGATLVLPAWKRPRGWSEPPIVSPIA